jgi:hypothetical protein
MLRDPVLRARVAAALSGLALAGAAASLWPGLQAPAWPACAIGLVAVALALEPGPIGPRAAATIGGAVAVLLGWVQVLALWGVALAL